MRPTWVLLLVTGCEVPPCDVRGVVCTVAGVGGTLGFNGDELDALGTWMYQPSAVVIAPDTPLTAAGTLVIDDFNNMRIRAVGSEDAVVRTVVGNGVHGNATPGAPVLESPLENPVDIAFGPDGALYIAELHGMRVLRVDGDGVIEPWAGVVAEPGYSGDGGDTTLARFNNVSSVAVDEAGSVYVADTGNHVIRRIDPDHTVHLVAGKPGVPGFIDGAEATFNTPQRVRYQDGRLWVADTYNAAVRVLDLDTGLVTTVAGTGTAGFAGDGGPATAAQLYGPFGATPLPDGSGFYIADSYNNRVRLVDASGVITTVAGDGQKAFGGDLGYAVDAQLNFPSDVLPDPDGGFWFTDMMNGAVRHVAD